MIRNSAKAQEVRSVTRTSRPAAPHREPVHRTGAPAGSKPLPRRTASPLPAASRFGDCCGRADMPDPPRLRHSRPSRRPWSSPPPTTSPRHWRKKRSCRRTGQVRRSAGGHSGVPAQGAAEFRGTLTRSADGPLAHPIETGVPVGRTAVELLAQAHDALGGVLQVGQHPLLADARPGPPRDRVGTAPYGQPAPDRQHGDASARLAGPGTGGDPPFQPASESNVMQTSSHRPAARRR